MVAGNTAVLHALMTQGSLSDESYATALGLLRTRVENSIQRLQGEKILGATVPNSQTPPLSNPKLVNAEPPNHEEGDRTGAEAAGGEAPRAKLGILGAFGV